MITINRTLASRLFTASAAMVSAGIVVLAGQASPIRWSQESLFVPIFQSGIRTIDISFKSKIDIRDADLFVVPEIAAFLSVQEPIKADIQAGEEILITLVVRIPKSQAEGTIEGTVHLRSERRTIAKPLPVNIQVDSAETVEAQAEQLLVQNFGTTTPRLEDGQRFLYLPDIPSEFSQILEAHSNLPAVFRIGSVVFTGNLMPQAEVALRGAELVDAMSERGINVDLLRDALPRVFWHQEDNDMMSLPTGAAAVTLLPPWGLYDTDGTFIPDTLIVIPDKTIHIVLRKDDVGDLIARGPMQILGLTSAGSTAAHELIHVHNFATKCGDNWTGLSREEEVTTLVGFLINDIFARKDSTMLTNTVQTIMQQFPQGINCLAGLDLTPPQPVILNSPIVTPAP